MEYKRIESRYNQVSAQLSQMEREIQKANELAEARRIERDEALQRVIESNKLGSINNFFIIPSLLYKDGPLQE